MCKAATNILKFGTALLHFNHENAIIQWICRALACDTGKSEFLSISVHQIVHDETEN